MIDSVPHGHIETVEQMPNAILVRSKPTGLHYLVWYQMEPGTPRQNDKLQAVACTPDGNQTFGVVATVDSSGELYELYDKLYALR